MQVDVETMGRCQTEYALEGELELRPGRLPQKRDAAECAAVAGDRIDDGAELGLVVDGEIARKEPDRLQQNAALPGLAHLGKDRPRNCGLRAYRVEMRTQRRGAMSERAAQRKVHAGPHILGAPVSVAVSRDRRARAKKGAIGIGPPRPDMT